MRRYINTLTINQSDKTSNFACVPQPLLANPAASPCVKTGQKSALSSSVMRSLTVKMAQMNMSALIGIRNQVLNEFLFYYCVTLNLWFLEH